MCAPEHISQDTNTVKLRTGSHEGWFSKGGCEWMVGRVPCRTVGGQDWYISVVFGGISIFGTSFYSGTVFMFN